MEGRELPIRDETHRSIALIRRRATSNKQLSAFLRDAILNQEGYWLGSAYSFRRNSFDIDRFEDQIGSYSAKWLKQTYLDLAIAPFLLLTNPAKEIGYAPDTRFFYRIHDKASMTGNVSPEKANETALKGRKINELIGHVMRENGASPAYLKRLELILQQYDFLSALYTRDFGKAARLYVRLARNLWNWRQLMKETERLLAVLMLGPEKFLILKNRA
jgi:hypothetical protein